jgi:hypothetical protein
LSIVCYAAKRETGIIVQHFKQQEQYKMSWLIHVLGQWLTALLTPPSAPAHPDTMNLQDWADLPAHHPVCDEAPC